MTNLPAQPARPTPDQGGQSPQVARLRATSAKASDRQVRLKVSRLARLLHGALVAAVSLNIMLFAAPELSGVTAAAMPVSDRIVAAVVVTTIFMVSLLQVRRAFDYSRLGSLSRSLFRIRSVLVGTIVASGIAAIFPSLHVKPLPVLATAVAIMATSAVWAMLTESAFGGVPVQRALIVGDGEKVRRFITEYTNDPHPQYELVGIINDSDAQGALPIDSETTLEDLVSIFDADDIGDSSSPAPEVPLLGTLDDLETIIASEAIDIVVVAVRRGRLELFARLSGRNGAPVAVQELPQFSERVFGRVPVDLINSAWFMHLAHPSFRGYANWINRLTDLVFASTLTLLSLPFLPLIAIGVKLSSPGPIFYSQIRFGERGREFKIWKFRTMRTDAEASGKAKWADERDPRITRFGWFLRSTRIDELPQLWNVLAGHMSFVGPRPERPEFVEKLERELPYYERRHLIKPGMTGWGQVRFGYANSVDETFHRLGYDLYYLKHRSAFFDLIIVLETFRVVLGRVGAK